MDRLEKAFEQLKEGKDLKKIIKSMSLTDEEIEYLKLALHIFKMQVTDFSKEDKKFLFEKIRENLPISSISNFRKRLLLGLASVLIASSTIAFAASSNAKPDSLLYPVKKAYIEMAGRVFYGSEFHKNLLKKEIRNYKNALKKTGVIKPEDEKRLKNELQKTMNLLKKLELEEKELKKSRKKDFKSDPSKKRTENKNRKFEKSNEKNKVEFDSRKETTAVNKNEIKKFDNNNASTDLKTKSQSRKDSEKIFNEKNK